MTAGVALATTLLVTVKVALLLPLATVTVVGTVALEESELNITTTPALGAGPLNVTVPWEVAPPLTLVGFNESVLNTAGLIVSVAVLVTPP